MRYTVRQSHQISQHLVLADCIDLEICVCKPLQVRDEGGLCQSHCDHPAVDSDSPEEWIPRESLQVIFQHRPARFEVPHDSHNQRVISCEIE